MKVHTKIREKILTDNDFSLDIAKLLGIQQYSVKELAKRNSDKLVLYHIVEFYKQKGFSIEDIFENESVESIYNE
jgi:predicted XRE-type DNA-binding protein